MSESASAGRVEQPSPSVSANKNDGPFENLYAPLGTTESGDFKLYHILGTGNYVRERVTNRRGQEEEGWLRVRGPDFGTVEEDGLMGMVMSHDDFASDGGIYMDHAGKPAFRSFRREDGLPGQPEGVTYRKGVLTFGQPAMSKGNIFVMLDYRFEGHGPGETERQGTAGLYYYDHAKKALHLILDNRSGRTPPSPATYEAGGHEYTVKPFYEVPGAADGKATRRWIAFELMIGANENQEMVFRGTYSDGSPRERTGVYYVKKTESRRGVVEFEVRALVDSGADVQVPGQPTGTTFQRVSSPWMNDAGVVVFRGAFQSDGSDANQGLFAIIDEVMIPIATNEGAEGIRFDDLEPERQDDDLRGLADRVEDSSALSTAASMDLILNNAGTDGLGNVFFAAGFWDGPSRRKGVFTASPRRDATGIRYDIREIVRSGTEGVPGTPAGFVFGSFHSFAVNDKNQLAFKAMAPDRPLGIMMFYDGSPWTHDGVLDDRAVEAIAVTGEHLPQPSTEPFWFIIGNYGLNNRGQFMFRVSTIAAVDGPRILKPAWACWRADFQGRPRAPGRGA